MVLRFVCCVLLISPLLFLTPLAIAASEKDYQQANCHGVQEYVLHDRTRVDCLTKTHAIEYDFGQKWYEAIGQALGYAFETGKRAGVVLILEEPKHYRYWLKLNSVIDHYALPIDTWVLEAYE